MATYSRYFPADGYKERDIGLRKPYLLTPQCFTIAELRNLATRQTNPSITFLKMSWTDLLAAAAIANKTNASSDKYTTFLQR